ncbi:MAG: isochorismatase family protein [Actinomycetota bacterium]
MVAPVQALIVIDVQSWAVAGDGAVPGAGGLLAAVRLLLAAARQAGSLVVHLQNDGPPGTADEPGQPGWRLHLPPSGGEPVLRKTHDDGFRGTDLGGVLAGRQATRLAVAGVMSEMCVAATARAALDRGFGVVLAHDAHATFDIPAVAGFGPAVPAAATARVAEWSLGDQVELITRAAGVSFAAGG